MDDIQHIIIHYLDGIATREEKQMLLKWLKESESHAQEFAEIRDLWLGSNAALSGNEDTETALQHLRKHIYNNDKKRRKKTPFLHHSIIKYAAVFCLAFGLAYWLFMQTITVPPENTLTINKLITSNNSKGRFVLPDSTIVWLNRNSILEYPEIFHAEKREVKLTGEGYFEVKKHSRAPFYVTAGNMAVEVKGTSFVVQNYENRKNIETILLSGKVNVAGNGYVNTPLLPGQRYSLNKEKGTYEVDTVKPDNYIGWINSKLVFDNQRLSDILTQMQGWYNIDISFAESYASNVRMTFTIRDESIDEILRAIKLLVPITSRWENQTLYIQPKR